MILSDKHKFIYAAFYKTGSSSIEESLDRYRGRISHYILENKYRKVFPNENEVFKHISPKEIRELVGHNKWSNYMTFAFVRNPWDRIVSVYHYHNQIIPNTFPLAQKPFEQWVRLGGSGSAKKLMSDFLCDENGDVIVDRIGRFENIQQDFRMICKELGISCDLPHYNKTKRKGYREYYTDETYEIVKSWVKPDLDMFDYKF